MQNTTSQRGALKDARIAEENSKWENAKAAYAEACRRFAFACDEDSRRDSEEMAFNQTSPTRTITFQIEPWERETEHCKIIMHGRRETIILDRNNLHRAKKDSAITNSPEFAAFQEEFAAWEAERERTSVDRGWTAIQAEWCAACDAQDAAWHTMVGCPITTLEHLAEKVEIARQHDMLDGRGLAEDLVEALLADLRQLSAV